MVDEKKSSIVVAVGSVSLLVEHFDGCIFPLLRNLPVIPRVSWFCRRSMCSASPGRLSIFFSSAGSESSPEPELPDEIFTDIRRFHDGVLLESAWATGRSRVVPKSSSTATRVWTVTTAVQHNFAAALQVVLEWFSKAKRTGALGQEEESFDRGRGTPWSACGGRNAGCCTSTTQALSRDRPKD